MWQDMGLYWAFRGTYATSNPPTRKRIEYREITMPAVYLNGPKQGEPITYSLAVAVHEERI